jgi:hypothetical protein
MAELADAADSKSLFDHLHRSAPSCTLLQKPCAALGLVKCLPAATRIQLHRFPKPTGTRADTKIQTEARTGSAGPRTMLWQRQGGKKGGRWGVVRYDNRSTNFFKLLGSCSRSLSVLSCQRCQSESSILVKHVFQNRAKSRVNDPVSTAPSLHL